MSNYPPGVTGHEYQIQGAEWDGDIERDCNAEDILLPILTQDVSDMIRAAPWEVMSNEWRRLLALLREAPQIEVSCQFGGSVYAQAHNGSLWWTCPHCGTEHEEEQGG